MERWVGPTLDIRVKGLTDRHKWSLCHLPKFDTRVSTGSPRESQDGGHSLVRRSLPCISVSPLLFLVTFVGFSTLL